MSTAFRLTAVLVRHRQSATISHPYDQPLTIFLFGKDAAHLLAACERAGITLLRDLAMPTEDELVERHGFSAEDAREVDELLTSRNVMHGAELQGMAQMYLRDLEGGEGNEHRARKQLTLLGVPIPRSPRRR